MDGGANNRKFIKLHADPMAIDSNNINLQNPLDLDHQIAVMMDPMVSYINVIENCDRLAIVTKKKKLMFAVANGNKMVRKK